jgi:hypothetical protein
MGNSPQKPSALAATYGSDGYKNLPGSSSAGKKVEWVILNHNNHQREIDVYIYIYRMVPKRFRNLNRCT